MTKKPIMIDDIDVSECEFYWSEQNLCNNGNLTSDCQENKDCIYKRYIRKEQECEELKKNYFTVIQQRNAAEQQHDKLKTENEELKKSTRNNKDKRKRAIERYLKLKEFTNKEFQELKAENEELKKTVDDLLHKPEIQDKILWKINNEALLGSKDAWIYKLEQALQNIKEIAENAEEQCAIPEDYFKRNNVSWKQHQLKGLTCKFNQILQKCEVIDD